jgi:hypothetical protein
MRVSPMTDGGCGAPGRNGWVDVSRHAIHHGFSGPVFMTHAAWMDSVYFVDDLADRLDPVRENWRLGRVLEEVSRAVQAHASHGNGPETATSAFSLSLKEGSDRLRSLSLPAAHLLVRTDHLGSAPTVRVDVHRDDAPRRGGHQIGHRA